MNSIVFCFATVVLVAVSVGGHNGFTLPGTYEMETSSKDENFGKYLKAIGIIHNEVGKIQQVKKVEVCIKHVEGEKWEVERKADGQSVKFTFESGKEFEVARSDGAKVKNTITVDREAHTAKRVVPLPKGEATTDVKFNPDPAGGFTATLKAGDATAVLVFKRVGK